MSGVITPFVSGGTQWSTGSAASTDITPLSSRNPGHRGQAARSGAVTGTAFSISPAAILSRAAAMVAGVVLQGTPLLAEPAGMDTTFGVGGVVTTTIAGDAYGQAVAVQGDGRILVAGYSENGGNEDIAVARYLTNGGLDASFNGTGVALTAIGTGEGDLSDRGRAVAVQDDGRIGIAFRCDSSRTDITYTVQASASLAGGTWTDIATSTGGGVVQAVGLLGEVADSGSGLRVVHVTASPSLFPAGRGFLRVRVSD